MFSNNLCDWFNEWYNISFDQWTGTTHGVKQASGIVLLEKSNSCSKEDNHAQKCQIFNTLIHLSSSEHDVFIVYSERNAIKSLYPTNESLQNSPIPEISNDTFIKNVIGLAVDYANQRLFFTDIQQGNIQTVYKNGTGLRIVVSGKQVLCAQIFYRTNRTCYW